MVNVMVMLLDAVIIVFVILLLLIFAIPFFIPILNQLITDNLVLIILIGAALVFLAITALNIVIADFAKK